MSPKMLFPNDPATVAVNALLEPTGKQLGLKDKAVLFGLVESLRRVCHQLQAGDELQTQSAVLRGRLDEARKALDGIVETRQIAGRI